MYMRVKHSSKTFAKEVVRNHDKSKKVSIFGQKNVLTKNDLL